MNLEAEDGCAPTSKPRSLPPLGPAPTLRTDRAVLRSTSFRADSGQEVHLYEVADDAGAIRTVLRADAPVTLSMSDAVALAHLLLSDNLQVPAGNIRHDRTLSAVEVVAIARRRGATHVSQGGAVYPVGEWAPYGKDPAASCARFVEHPDLPSVYIDASQPEARPGGWAFVTLEPAGELGLLVA